MRESELLGEAGAKHGRAQPENHGAREREPRRAFPLASLRGAAYPSPYR